jgi:tetratricopeptide (TPR) repeat protein
MFTTIKMDSESFVPSAGERAKSRRWYQPAILVSTALFLAINGSVLGGVTGGASAVQAATGKSASAIGLDARTVQLVNRGEWKEVISRLESLTGSETEPSRMDGWLAFAYLFQGQCKECKSFAEKVAEYKGTAGDQVAAQAVQCFSQICDGKLEDAQKTLEKLGQDNQNDVLVNFALAAVAGKRGQAAAAIGYCQKAVVAAPDFAWGYRTLGFIEDRWLKDMTKAESDYEQALAIEPNFPEARDLLVDVRLVKNNFDGAVDAAQAGIKLNPRDAKSYYRLAQIYIQQWRLREALQQLKKAIALNSKEAKYHRTRATILRYQGQLGEALKEQQSAVELSKDKAFELVEMASLNMMAGNTNRAADNLSDALKLDADNAAAHQKLVQLLTQEKRYDDLVAEFKRSVERRPKDASLHLGLARALKNSGKAEQATAELKEAANLDPKDPIPHREIGSILIAQRDYGAAAKEYTRALNINPSSVEDLVSLGYCYAQNEDYLQAEAALVTGIALQQLSGQQSSVGHLDLMRSLAALLLEEGRYADAASQLEAVCASAKGSANSGSDQFMLAEAKALRDRTDTAARDLVAAFEKLSDAQKSEQRYALIESLLTAEKYDSAVEQLAKIPDKDGKPDVQVLVLNSRAWQGKNDLEKALKFATQAVEVKAAEVDKQCAAQSQLARILLLKGDLQAAESAAKKGMELGPKSYEAYEVAGRAALLKSDNDQALAAGKKALEINPYFASAYLLVGDARGASGNWKEAADSYKKAAELYPGWLATHKSLLNAYERQSLKDEARKVSEQIEQIEKRN